MTNNQLSFFATKADLESLLRAIESVHLLQFVVAGLFDSPNVEPQKSLVDVPNLGSTAARESNHDAGYLVFAQGISIAVRPVPQRHGGVKYAVDQFANPTTIVFRPGGAFGAMCLIAGQVGTVSDTANLLALFHRFSREVRHQFTKIKSFYVGKEAEELLDKGWRLTGNLKSPAVYDLKRD